MASCWRAPDLELGAKASLACSVKSLLLHSAAPSRERPPAMEFMPPGTASTLVPAAAASSVSGVGAICDFKRKDIAFRS